MSYTVYDPIQTSLDPDLFAPLAGGTVYFGVPNGNPQAVVGDRVQVYLARQGLSDLAISQPVSIGPGGHWYYNGNPAQIKILVPYCVQAFNSLGVQEYYAASAGDEITKLNEIDATLATTIKTVATFAELATTDADIGQQVCLLGHTQAGIGGGIFDVVSSSGLVADGGLTAINGAVGFIRKCDTIYLEYFGAIGDGVADDTVAVNLAYDWATDQSVRPSIFGRPDATYLCGNLLFGTQSTGSGSDSPAGFIGGGWSTTLKAKPGTTGIFFKAWSVAGCTFRDFQIDLNGTSANVDFEWKPGAGPSCQNTIENIRVIAGTAPTVVNLKNQNDTFPRKLVVNCLTANQCAIDMTQSGGLSVITESIWNVGYLKFGCQNGSINGCWGNGIMLSQSCLNYIGINSSYLYANSHLDALIKSESFSSLQSARAISCRDTQFITDNYTSASYFNVNLYSGMNIDNCQFIGPTTALYGASTRNDSFEKALVKITGGSSPNAMVINSITGIKTVTEKFINDNTGFYKISKWIETFTPVISGSVFAGAGTYTLQQGNAYREGNTINVELRVTWTAHTGTGNLRITGLPFTQSSPGNVGANIGYAGNTFGGTPAIAIVASNIVTFYDFAGAAIAMTGTGDLLISVSYTVA